MLNRIENDLADWNKTERHYRKLFGDDVIQSKVFKRTKLAHLEVMELKYKALATPLERGALQIIREQRREQEQLLYPNFFSRMLYRAAKSLLERPKAVKQHKMAADNLNGLQKQLEIKGLSGAYPQLLKQIIQGDQSITSSWSVYVEAGERMEYSIEVQRNAMGGYDLKDIRAGLLLESAAKRPEFISLLKNDLQSVNARQAYNLLSGRSVQIGDTSLQLDFNDKDAAGNLRTKVFPAGFGFDIEKVLSEFKIKELKDPVQKQMILDALKNGDKVKATEVGKPKEITLEANANRKSLGEKIPADEQVQGQRSNVVAFQPKQQEVKPSKKTRIK